jgi:hypothetical protein
VSIHFKLSSSTAILFLLTLIVFLKVISPL